MVGLRGLAPPSIRNRLVHAVVGWGIVWVTLMALTLAWVVQDEVDDLADAGLQESAEWLFELSLRSPDSLRTGVGEDRMPAHPEKLIWQRVDAQGHVLGRSHNAPDVPLFAEPMAGVANAAGEWRVFGLVLPDGAGQLYVADRLAERWATRRDAALGAVTLTLVMGAAFVVWLRRRVQRELMPLVTLSQQVVAYDPVHQPQALEAPLRQELTPIHDAVMALGQRLLKRIDRERAFSAHAAHALRTPLAGMDAQLAMALRESTPQQRSRLLRTREAASRLNRVVLSMLTLFRRVDRIQWQAVELAPLMNRMGIEGLDIGVEAAALVHADPDLLAAALINLLDNVLRHGGTRVTLTVLLDLQFQTIVVRDNGPGMDPERLDTLRRALALQAYEGQMGLGLMLADLVARAHGGTLHLVSASEGLHAELILRRPPVKENAAVV